MRAWIETLGTVQQPISETVALRVRAWIETSLGSGNFTSNSVALRVRAWIETPIVREAAWKWCRPPREGVD